jgi:hypothetical protein
MASQIQMHHDVLHATDTALRLVNQALGDLVSSDVVVGPTSSIAASGVRDGLDRALAVVAELEREATESRDPVRRARYAALSETLHGVLAHARLRDVTGRRLADAAVVVADATDSQERADASFGPR